MSAPDDHRSIGEVLDLLQGEFPDVTVSKIRFLESQGLIAPERTPSGYRKFYDPDIERLRWILVQQRDHFLPLKVIKGRLAQLEESAAVSVADDPGGEPAPVPVAGVGDFAMGSVADDAIPEPPSGDGDGAAKPTPTRTDGVAADGAADADGEPATLTSGAALSKEELSRASGLDTKLLDELEGFGLLPAPRVSGDEALYDEHALVIARLARGFLKHGVEARHLRMYRTFAEREAAFVGQLVNPLLRQKNPESRQQARETVAELAKLGGGMRAAMLRIALRDAVGE